MQATSGSIDDVIYNLANVKLAMSGDKRNEVIKMLSQLLHEAVEVIDPPFATPAPFVISFSIHLPRVKMFAFHRATAAHEIHVINRWRKAVLLMIIALTTTCFQGMQMVVRRHHTRSVSVEFTHSSFAF